MKKTLHRIVPNFKLRQELIDKGLIIPPHLLGAWLRSKGYEEAGKAAEDRWYGRR